jgi:hypothetical protein
MNTKSIIVAGVLSVGMQLTALTWQDRLSEPYISGDAFASLADWLWDNPNQERSFHVQIADIVFVQTNYLKQFFTKQFPYIEHPFILITHNTDDSAPGEFRQYLDDPRIIVWFVNNPDYVHPKLVPIPIGLKNRFFKNQAGEIEHSAFGCPEMVKAAQSTVPLVEKKHLLYLNYTAANHAERDTVLQLFAQAPFCFNAPKKNFAAYLIDVAQSQFVLSPRGVGLDCYRTWEALLMGAFPVVRTSPLDSIYEGLPVVIVKDWSEVTESFLHQKWQEMSGKTYATEKLYFAYWRALIKKVQQDYRDGLITKCRSARFMKKFIKNAEKNKCAV